MFPFGTTLTCSTVHGIPVSEAVIGERWTDGSTLLEVAQPASAVRQARPENGRSALLEALRGHW
jgi:MOSC domain-containing protein YiiM